MSYPKHEGSKPPKKSRRSAKPTDAERPIRVMLKSDPDEIVSTTDSIGYAGLSEIAEQLSKIQNSLRSYNANACDGEMSFTIGLHMGKNQDPIRLEFDCNAVNSIADSLKRIADAFVTKCPPGV